MQDLNYTKLPYYQYFTDNSCDINNKGTARFKIEYIDVPYSYKGILNHADYEIHYEKERNVIQINFEGSKEGVDWITNFIFLPKYYDTFVFNNKKITLRVHTGWAFMYKAIKHQVRDKVKELKDLYPHSNIEIVGWSLGSGQAMLCAQDLYYNLGVKSYLYTFGSVNPFKTNIFNRGKILKYLRGCCYNIYNFCDRSDIVTYAVPRIFGFVKLRRVNLKGRFKFFGLFRPFKYHLEYDSEYKYAKIYKKESKM